MVRVTVVRQYNTNICQGFRFWVRNVQAAPEVNNSIKMEVGIEDCLHIEFEYAKAKYSLKVRAAESLPASPAQLCAQKRASPFLTSL